MKLLSIGKFSRLTGMSVKTLRWYDEQGLLPPAHIDGLTKYRFYTLGQCQQAREIQQLRQARMPLADIQVFLQAEIGRRTELLVRRQVELETEITELQHAIRHLKRLQRPEEETMFEVTTREVGPTRYLSLSLPLPVPASEEELAEQNVAIMQAWQSLCRSVGKEYMLPDDVSWLAFPPSDGEAEEQVHVCLQLRQGEVVSQIIAGVLQCSLPPRTEAVVVRQGMVQSPPTFGEADHAWASLLRWLEENGRDTRREIRQVTVHPHQPIPDVEYATTL